MAIPKGITREGVIQAMKDYESARHHFRDSTKYDVLDRWGNAYPPNAIVGLAARRLNGGKPLTPKDVKGGEGAGASNSLLRELGFRIVDKTYSARRPDYSARRPDRAPTHSTIEQRIKKAAAERQAFIKEKSGIETQLTSLPGQM